MSNLAAKTEREALVVLAKAVLLFERLANLDMAAYDAFDARKAENILKSIIEDNGYTVQYNRKKGQQIITKTGKN
jgi:hypothetical protein